MKSTTNKNYLIPIFVGTALGAVAGGILGVFAYYGQWLG
jgi:hypothetical protein